MSCTTFAAAGCFHCPLQDKDAIAWMLGRLEAVKPDVFVMLGDLFEADSASRWPSEYDWDLEDEFRAANDVLARIRKVIPKARKVFLPGNHDDNLLALDRIPCKIRGRCDWRVKQYNLAGEWLNEELLTKWERPCGYIYDRRRGVFRLGQVGFSHGFESGSSSDEFQSILLGQPFGLFVSAHTHRPTLYIGRAKRTAAVPLPFWFANVGCLRELKPPYMQRKRSHNWGQAMVFGEAVDLKSPRMSKHWDARVEVFRMSDPDDMDS